MTFAVQNTTLSIVPTRMSSLGVDMALRDVFGTNTFYNRTHPFACSPDHPQHYFHYFPFVFDLSPESFFYGLNFILTSKSIVSHQCSSSIPALHHINPPITSQHKNSPPPYHNSRDLDFASVMTFYLDFASVMTLGLDFASVGLWLRLQVSQMDVDFASVQS